ncbi:peptide/nickel transport system permease protein [Sphingomonas sp. YR710]|uniref:ABC transporter permease n=1 Tax=Sphingomonas sp. YR710 TaxID=1882773 RepID=UPI0008883310|nr:ABC transporter permease [Sphingomonas sp. YR710]SDD26281.1 peptide/nickel transport system permease protein [Sphingomonas sp. YR710]
MMRSRLPGLIAWRLASALGTMLLVSIVIFGMSLLMGGDAAEAILGQSATPEALAGLRAAMHLDRPAYWRYLSWLGGLLSGHPGTSLVTGLPVATMIGPRLASSLLLAGLTALVSVPIALTFGILAAVKRGSIFDRTVSVVSIAIVSVPEFLIATLAVMLFAVTLHWLPALSSMRDVESLGGMARVFAMPVISLACVVIAQMIRMTRAAVIDALDSSYAEAAVLKGVSPARIVLRHALPNAMGAIANAVALSLSVLLGGVIVVEIIFNYPGVARLMVDAVATRDMPLVQTIAMIFCGSYLILVTSADIVAILSNPRLRYR